MPTAASMSLLAADRATGGLLGRALTESYTSAAQDVDFSSTTTLPQPQPPSFAAAFANHPSLAPDDVSVVQSPLLVGLEHSSALIHALLASFSVILVSELGDKTFIITAIMAMKNSRSLVFMSSALALFSMTVLSVGMGVAVTVIPELYTHYVSIVLFLCFGVKMLKEAYDMQPDVGGGESEFEEVKRSLEEEEEEAEEGQGAMVGAGEKLADAQEANDEQASQAHQEGAAQLKTQQQAAPNGAPSNWKRLVDTLYVAPIVIKVFTMIFVAEWGDRSQISTVILAAREDVVGVFVGSFSGHVLCTGLAVIGGRVVAEIISIRTLTFIGGIIFLFFAAFAIVAGPE